IEEYTETDGQLVEQVLARGGQPRAIAQTTRQPLWSGEHQHPAPFTGQLRIHDTRTSRGTLRVDRGVRERGVEVSRRPPAGPDIPRDEYELPVGVGRDAHSRIVTRGRVGMSGFPSGAVFVVTVAMRWRRRRCGRVVAPGLPAGRGG
ncbi:MAG: hypothetical protein LC776_06750, partial [Acidobacteria bacterium]|nr:hypothetical protein [Acidobacteriota bacterium]